VAARIWEKERHQVPLLYIRRASVEITSNSTKIGVGWRFSIEQRDLHGDDSWGKHRREKRAARWPAWLGRVAATRGLLLQSRV